MIVRKEEEVVVEADVDGVVQEVVVDEGEVAVSQRIQGRAEVLTAKLQTRIRK